MDNKGVFRLRFACTDKEGQSKTSTCQLKVTATSIFGLSCPLKV